MKRWHGRAHPPGGEPWELSRQPLNRRQACATPPSWRYRAAYQLPLAHHDSGRPRHHRHGPPSFNLTRCSSQRLAQEYPCLQILKHGAGPVGPGDISPHCTRGSRLESRLSALYRRELRRAKQAEARSDAGTADGRLDKQHWQRSWCNPRLTRLAARPAMENYRPKDGRLRPAESRANVPYPTTINSNPLAG